MSWVDVVIAVLVLTATLRGYHVGLLRQVGRLVGFVSGFVIGVLIAPSIADHFDQNPTRPLVAAFVVGFCVLALAVLGRRVGGMANLALRRLNLGVVDRVTGAVFSAVGTLIMCWLVASLLVNVTVLDVSAQIARSRILAAMDHLAPPVPSVEAKVQALFRAADFPSVFSSVVQPLESTLQLPSTATADAAAGNAAASVLKVTGVNACGYDREGTAFVVGPNELVTAAHVVAGAHVVLVDGVAATVIWFDPDNDVAVLALATGARAVIALAGATPPVGTAAAVLGYPENGKLKLVRAAVAGVITAQGRDIYDNTLVTRPLVVADTDVAPGNSGSPLLVDGSAVGLIFSRSVAQANVAYAVPSAVVSRDVAAAVVRGDRSVGATACVPD